MIPVQDVVPSGRAPITTLALIAINIVIFTAQTVRALDISTVVAPFTHVGALPFAVSVLWLWLFGDNVEARLGRWALLLIYLMSGWVSGLGAVGAVTGVLGAYFVLLPRSRVLTLVPIPYSLVEVPAAFFLGVWSMLNLVRFVARPSTLWTFGLAFAIGAATAWVMRRPVKW